MHAQFRSIFAVVCLSGSGVARAACPTPDPDWRVCADELVCDFQTVVEAVDASVDGDVICVEPGAYRGVFAVRGVRLQIEAAHPDGVVFSGGQGPWREAIAVEDGAELKLSGISLGLPGDGRCAAVRGLQSRLWLDGGTIQRCPVARNPPVFETAAAAMVDADSDGFFTPDDCDDGNPAIFPGAVEIVADGVDQDCDAMEACHGDGDGDTFGHATEVALSTDLTCLAAGVSNNTTDCNDGDAAIHPNGLELVSDGVDQDCDAMEECHDDGDGDTFGHATLTALSSALSCVAAGVANNADDCNDGNAAINPNGVELISDGVDQDCDAMEECHDDGDGDTFGHATLTALSSTLSCVAAGVANNADDCNDGNAAINPGALELIADGVDQDCDAMELCHDDNDGDTYGHAAQTLLSANLTCVAAGVANNADDCDDGDSAIHPGAFEPCDDQTDADCDGNMDEDGDGLGWPEEVANGTSDCLTDTDNDQLTDLEEVRTFPTSPTDADSDGDSVIDGLDGPPPLNHDTDGDIDAVDADDDNDTVPTIDEEGVGGGDVDGDGTINRLDTDDDGDGVLTADEDPDNNGDPRSDDTDLDGVANWADSDDDGDGRETDDEITYGADPLSIDTDSDSVLDGVEWGAGAVPRDSDGDGDRDIDDQDDDNDGIMTLAEGSGDLDLDGVPNHLDDDSDGDGALDSVEGTGDLDGDGAPNFLDANDNDGDAGDPDSDGLTTGEENLLCSGGVCALPFNPDSDDDGVDDGMEAPNPAAPVDTDGDALPDILDPDDDGDGIPSLEETGLVCSNPIAVFDIGFDQQGLTWTCSDGEVLTPDYRDTDGDGTADILDTDDDGDGIDTLIEGTGDIDGDGVPNWLDRLDGDGPNGDADGDGIANLDEVALGTDPYDQDSDGDGLLDTDELSQIGGEWVPMDSDGDGTHDAIDPDDDGDGVPTLVEGTVDTDGDGTPDYLDLDSDNDGLPDEQEGIADADCDLRPDRVDPIDDGPCDTGVDDTRDTYTRQGCACDGSGGGAVPGLALGVALLLLRRRRRVA